MNKHRQLNQLLQQLESELTGNNLWSSQSPTPQQLNSQVPFASDVMPFEQWLQFIFIPKLQYLIEQQQPLPINMSVTPMAEVVFAQEYQNVQQTLKAIDQLCAGVKQ